MWWFVIPIFRFRTHRRCDCHEPTAPAESVKRPSWALLWGLLFFPAIVLDAHYPGLWPVWIASIVASCWCGVMAYRPRPASVVATNPGPEPPRPQAYYSNRR